MTSTQDTRERDGTGEVEPEPIDAELVPEAHEPNGNGHALVVRQVTNEVIRPLAPADVKAAMVEHQALLQEILDPSDWQGPPNKPGSFVKKSGWRKVALAYNLAVERVGEEVERDEEGKPLRASYTARAIAPNQRAMEATGHCSFSESRFSGPRGNVSKLENDMRATAETRAKNRAISDLIGMGKVSAEEVDASHGPAFGPVVGDPQPASNALTYLLGDQEAAAGVWVELKQAMEYMPQCVADAIVAVARKQRALRAPEEMVASIGPDYAVELQDKIRAAGLRVPVVRALLATVGVENTDGLTGAQCAEAITRLTPEQAEKLEVELGSQS